MRRWRHGATLQSSGTTLGRNGSSLTDRARE
jgi:hypothetical protein